MRRRYLLIFVAVLVALVAWRAWAILLTPKTTPLDTFGEVADFKLTERDGRTVQRSDLLGKVWVASCIFSRCTGPCQEITGSMARLQAEFKDEPDFHLVSVSVDPENDTTDVLTKYATRNGARPNRWSFLTGSTEAVDKLVTESFYQAVQRAKDQETTHGTRLVLVDRQGRIRGLFEGRKFDETLPKLKQAVISLLQER